LKKKINIKTFYSFCGIVLSCIACFSQHGLELPTHVKKDKISFELVNNLVIIPVEVNGDKLSFLLDTGVYSTILFGITEADSLRVNNAKPIKIRGLGEGEGVIALKSENNELRIGDALDKNHSIYVIFEESLNFSTRMGIPIHGIIGYDFFKNFVVKTNYISKKLTFYDPLKYREKPCNDCESFDLQFHNKKPYVTIKIATPETALKEITLLVDSGSSDALWLFNEEGLLPLNDEKYFDDFLGLGFSGNIFGKRSKLDEVWLGSFYLQQVKVAFPDKSATEGVKFFEERDGSIGGDILKRFTVIMDYRSNKMILEKNSGFSEPFYYNMAGLTIEHDGVDVITELTTHSNFDFAHSGNSENSTGSQTVSDVSVFTQISLVPRYVIVNIREGSPAAEAGLKVGDEIVTINGRAAYKIKLFELNALFSSRVGKRISLKVKRNNLIFKVAFTLKKVI
jgi:hypothetical protein